MMIYENSEKAQSDLLWQPEGRIQREETASSNPPDHTVFTPCSPLESGDMHIVSVA